MPYIGRKIKLGVSKEATRGTPKATPDFWVRILAQNHKDKAEYIHSEGSVAGIVEHSHSEIDKQWGEGGFEAEIDADSIGLIFYALMGDVTTTVIEATKVWRHTYDLDEDADHQSLSLWISEPTKSVVYPLACMSNLSFSFERGKLLDFGVGMRSQKSSNALTAPAFEPLKAFRPKDFKFYLADDIAGLATADEVPLRTMNLSFEKNLEDDDVLGEESPQNFFNKVFAPSASISLVHEDSTYRDLFKAGTPKAMRIKIENPEIVLDAGDQAEGTVTVVNYANLATDTLTVKGVALVEGTHWHRGASNNAAASSLNDAINRYVEGVESTVLAAAITVKAEKNGVAGNAITLATTDAVNLTISGATLSGGVDDKVASIEIDFARVYFSDYDPDNSRSEIKKDNITFSFGVNTAEATIPFGQIRVENGVEEY